MGGYLFEVLLKMASIIPVVLFNIAYLKRGFVDMEKKKKSAKTVSDI
jgi:hypothetical protein